MKKLVIVDESRTAIETLALNEACLEAVANGQFDKITRVYSFSRPGVILSTSEDVWDIREQVRDHIDITRRPTGGSVVYVDGDTLGYSVFLRTQGPTSITRVYKKFTDRVLQAFSALGVSDLSMGNWYLRWKGSVIAGHAQQHRKGATEFQGLLRVKKWDMGSLDKTLRLRKLADHNGSSYLIIDDKVYNLDGPETDISVSDTRIVRDEYAELERASGLDELGLTIADISESIATALSGLSERHALPEEIVKRATVLEARYADSSYILNSGNRRGLGHCFVDLVDSE